MEYYFKIGRDFGNDNEFSIEVSSIEDAIIVENIVATIANSDMIDVDASIGGVKVMENGEWTEYMNDDFEDFDTIKHDKPELSDKIFSDKKKVEKIVIQFMKYLDAGLNWRFFYKMVYDKLKVA